MTTSRVTVRYLGYRVDILDERHVTIYDPTGQRLIAGVRMTESGVRRFIRGYRAAYPSALSAYVAIQEPGEVRP